MGYHHLEVEIETGSYTVEEDGLIPWLVAEKLFDKEGITKTDFALFLVQDRLCLLNGYDFYHNYGAGDTVTVPGDKANLQKIFAAPAPVGEEAVVELPDDEKESFIQFGYYHPIQKAITGFVQFPGSATVKITLVDVHGNKTDAGELTRDAGDPMLFSFKCPLNTYGFTFEIDFTRSYFLNIGKTTTAEVYLADNSTEVSDRVYLTANDIFLLPQKLETKDFLLNTTPLEKAQAIRVWKNEMVITAFQPKDAAVTIALDPQWQHVKLSYNKYGFDATKNTTDYSSITVQSVPRYILLEGYDNSTLAGKSNICKDGIVHLPWLKTRPANISLKFKTRNIFVHSGNIEEITPAGGKTPVKHIQDSKNEQQRLEYFYLPEECEIKMGADDAPEYTFDAYKTVIDKVQLKETTEVLPHTIDITWPNIISIEFLNRANPDDATELTVLEPTDVTAKKHIQYVNLEMDDKWIDNGVDIYSRDRLSQKTPILAVLNVKGKNKFKVKYKPDANNVVFTNTEENRNANFKFQKTEKDYETDKTQFDGEKMVLPLADFFLTSAAMDKYEITGWTEYQWNITISKVQIETNRLVYYQEIVMQKTDGTQVPKAANLTIFTTTYDSNGIKLAGLTLATAAYMENIGTDAESNQFQADIDTVKDTSKAPYFVAIGYTDHLAVKDSDVAQSPVHKGAGVNDVVVDVVNAAGTSSGVWNNIVTGEDHFGSNWATDSYFIEDGKPDIPANRVAIDKADCTLQQSGAFPADYKNQVKVVNLPNAAGNVVLSLNVINRMRTGLSFGGDKICVCTKVWYQTRSTNEQNKTLVHEFGHKIGMTADGTGTLPDKVPNHYYKMGNHCYYPNVDESTNGTCVMYGVTHAGRSSDYCPDCKPAVQKIDLSSGF